MKVTVIQMFQDIETGAYHNPGDTVEVSDSKRVDELVNHGLVEAEDIPSKPKKTTSKK